MSHSFADLSRFAEKNKRSIRIEENVLLSKKTTFKIGGPADVGIFPETEEDLLWAVEACSHFEIPVYLLGRGSNMLCDDEGFRGAVIFTENMCGFEREENSLLTLAGTGLTPLAREAGRLGLAGLEFACGIPGSVGGAVLMNAGAYGGEIKDVIKSVRVLNPSSLTVEEYENSEDMFSYRHSIFMDSGAHVISARLELFSDIPEEIRKREDELLSRRREKQPLEYPSAGSAFKRPEGYFAAKLIEDAGLKGVSVGGAEVSEKHSGFVINRKDATSLDVISLLNLVRERVFNEFGVVLSPEIRYLSPEGEKDI